MFFLTKSVKIYLRNQKIALTVGLRKRKVNRACLVRAHKRKFGKRTIQCDDEIDDVETIAVPIENIENRELLDSSKVAPIVDVPIEVRNRTISITNGLRPIVPISKKSVAPQFNRYSLNSQRKSASLGATNIQNISSVTPNIGGMIPSMSNTSFVKTLVQLNQWNDPINLSEALDLQKSVLAWQQEIHRTLQFRYLTVMRQ